MTSLGVPAAAAAPDKDVADAAGAAASVVLGLAAVAEPPRWRLAGGRQLPSPPWSSTPTSGKPKDSKKCKEIWGGKNAKQAGE